jgi:hypothetical protein
MPNQAVAGPAVLIRDWGDLGVRLAVGKARRLRATNKAFALMSDVGRAYRALQLRRLQEAILDWEEALSPIEDPLRVQFGLNRWLAGSREEAYSDWLAWVLQELRSSALVGRLLFGDGTPEANRLAASIEYHVQREVWVPEGHEGHAGRLDCVLRFDDAVVVLELKRSDAEHADIAKHEGYLKWLDGEQEHFKRGLLIATSTENHESYKGFALVHWQDLCMRARHLVCELRSGNRLVFLATFCAFIGAVEQNLLGFPYVGGTETHYEMNGQALERVIAYLAGHHRRQRT